MGWVVDGVVHTSMGLDATPLVRFLIGFSDCDRRARLQVPEPTDHIRYLCSSLESEVRIVIDS